MKGRCGFCKIVGLVLVIGGINWGLVGLFNYDVVAALFGPMSVISRLIYILVGLSALMLLIGYCKRCPKCNKTGTTTP